MEMPNELRRALKSHERVPTFINRLVVELSKVDRLRLDQIKDATESLTEIFVASVQAAKDQKALSPLEVARINEKYKARRTMQLEVEAEILRERDMIDRARAKFAGKKPRLHGRGRPTLIK